MPQPHTEFLHLRGLPLALHRWGEPELPAVLMLHGFLDHGRAFQPMAEALSDRFCVYAPDLRGHGLSGWVGAGGNYYFTDYYFDVSVLLQQLARPVHLLGHSMGGMIACGIAALYPERVQSVVLLDGMGPPEGQAAQALPRLRHWLEALSAPGFGGDVAERQRARRVMPTLDVAADRLQLANPRLTRERAWFLAVTGTEAVPGGVVWRHDPLHRTPSARPFRGDEAQGLWAAIQAPVLSIHASDSPWRPTDLAARHGHVRNLVAATLADASHNLHHEQPERLAAAVAAWFTQPGVAAPDWPTE